MLAASNSKWRSIGERSIRVLPGQYYDAETGTHYNYFRDYDPAIGRYIESDPIGLLGGVNTYAYVKNDPIKRIDPKGLFFTCGSGWSQWLIPDNPMLYPFQSCCEDHDTCYADCAGPSKSTCDDNFHTCMKRNCGRYGGDSLIACEAWADLYYGGITESGVEQ
jgi:RHS repeat-associated protein